jgi:HEAT repeat protein
MFRVVVALLALLPCVGCNDIGSMRSRRDTEGLLKMLSDSDPTVRVRAIDALGKVGDSRTVDALIKSLGDDNAYVREHAARNLGCDYHSTLGCDLTKTVDPLISILDDEDTFVRVEASRSLGENPHPEAREPLEALAKRDSHWEVRREAAISLGRISRPESAPTLEALVRDEDETVRDAARRALRRLAATQPISLSDRHRGEPIDEEAPSVEPPAPDAAVRSDTDSSVGSDAI